MESSSATSSNSELEKRASPKLRVLPLNNFILSLTYHPQQAAKQMGGHSSYTSLTYLSSFSRTMFQFFGFRSLTKKYFGSVWQKKRQLMLVVTKLNKTKPAIMSKISIGTRLA
jgi:hypothetical protein